jgi:phosphohistidine phosphatase SixA
MVTVLLVRHADIDLSATPDNPPLNSAGEQRAKALVHVAGGAGIAAIFTSSFLRTKETVAPLASRLQIQPREAPDAPILAQQLLSGAAGPVVLVAGHSNTVPEIIAALGAASAAVTIGHREFDNLFVVTASQSGEASALHLKYGTASD